MKLFMSMSSNPMLHLRKIEEIAPLEELYILCSYEYRVALKQCDISRCKDFIADSGAFTAMNAGKTIDEEYVDKYISFINDNNIDHFIEMDLDEVAGYDRTIELRKKVL